MIRLVRFVSSVLLFTVDPVLAAETIESATPATPLNAPMRAPEGGEARPSTASQYRSTDFSAHHVSEVVDSNTGTSLYVSPDQIRDVPVTTAGVLFAPSSSGSTRLVQSCGISNETHSNSGNEHSLSATVPSVPIASFPSLVTVTAPTDHPQTIVITPSESSPNIAVSPPTPIVTASDSPTRGLQPQAGATSSEEVRALASLSTQASQRALGQSLISEVRSVERVYRQREREDQARLEDAYRGVNSEEWTKRMERAQNTLRAQRRHVQRATSGISRQDQAHFDALHGLAEAQASYLSKAIAPQSRPGSTPGAIDAVQLSALLAGGSPNDRLSTRMALLAGLPEKEQSKLLSKLQLARKAPLQSYDQSRAHFVAFTLNEPFRNSNSAELPQCSSILHSVLHPSLRLRSFSTQDFYSISVLKKFGSLPLPPHLLPRRKADLERAATAFENVDLYYGDSIEVGDLLIYKVPWIPGGKVWLVTRYDPVLKRAHVLRYIEGEAEVREEIFDLSLDPIQSSDRRLRAGLIALRPNHAKNKLCRYEAPSNGRGI